MIGTMKQTNQKIFVEQQDEMWIATPINDDYEFIGNPFVINENEFVFNYDEWIELVEPRSLAYC